MNALRAFALGCLLAAFGLGAYGVASGQLTVGLFLIVPFVSGTGLLPLAVFGLFVVAMVLWAMGTLREAARSPMPYDAPPMPPAPGVEGERETRVRSGGVVLLGPIPIVWGDARVLPWMVAAGAALLALGLALAYWL